jgi:acetyl esterase/lipase
MKHILVLLISFASLGSFGQQFSTSWKDVNYAGDSMVYHNLDIYLPLAEKEIYPVVIYIYGSAWFSNNLKGADLPTIGKALLDAGFAVVMPNHRSSRDAIFPAQVHDIKAVTRFLRGNAEKYRIDPSFIGISGSSSGGNLASMAGATVNVKKKTLGNQTIDVEGELGGYTSYSSSVDAVVAWFPPTNMLVMDSCGGTDFIHNDARSPASLYIGGPIQDHKELCLLASPTSYVDTNNPPFLIFHGTSDRVVPYCQSIILHNALQSAGTSTELRLAEGGQHGPGVHIEKNINRMVEFFEREAAKKTGWHTGDSRNLFLETGYHQEEIDRKIEKATFDLMPLIGKYRIITPDFKL